MSSPSTELSIPWFYPTAEGLAQQQRILASRYFLVRIAGNGSVWRCRRCGGKHDFLTLMCVPQPFSGLSRGLYAYWKTVGAYEAVPHLSPAERARMRELDRMFGPASGLPDLASAHPQTVRALGVDPRDADLGAYSFVASSPSSTALGLVEPISEAQAIAYGRRINLRGIRPAFTLPGLEGKL